MGIQRLFAELRRRNVLRAVVFYAGAVWALAQGIAQLAPALGGSDAIVRWFLLAAALGFPVWVVLAWVYELTPLGLKRESEIAADASIPRTSTRKQDLAIIVVLAIAVVLLASRQILQPRAPDAPPAPVAALDHSVAVLPFRNLSGNADNAYFAAGMQDLILTKLAGIRGLRVISRTSVEGYQSNPSSVRAIAAELGVAAVLEGSVQRSGDRVLINVQLVSGRDDSHLWAESYQRTLDDVFGVEGEVAGKIADALQTRLSPGETAALAQAPTRNKAALDLYLRAESFAYRGHRDYDTGQLAKAADLYRQAIANDTGFALAIARLSYVESELAWFGGGGSDVNQLNMRARLDAERAAQLAPELPAAQLAQGYSAYWGRGDLATARQAFDRALALQPGNVDALMASAFVLRRGGDPEAAAALLEKVRLRDPRNSVALFELGNTYLIAGNFTQAVKWLEQALRIDPDNLNARFFLSNAILFSTGDPKAAMDPLRGNDPYMQLQRGTLLVYQRRYREAQAEVEGVPDTPENFQPGLNPPKSLQLADLHRLQGDLAGAAPLYAQALEELHAQLTGQRGVNLAFVWSNLAGAEVGLGHREAALAAIAKSQAIISTSQDQLAATAPLLLNAVGYAQLGRADLAVPLLTRLFAVPGVNLNYAPIMLKLDPAWDPIRTDASFQQLLLHATAGKPQAPGAGVNGD